jgi:hypothetical protein
MAVARHGRSMTLTWPKPHDVEPGGTQVPGHRDVRQDHGAVSPLEALARPTLVGDSRTAALAGKAGHVHQRATRPRRRETAAVGETLATVMHHGRGRRLDSLLDLSFSIPGSQSQAKSAIRADPAAPGHHTWSRSVIGLGLRRCAHSRRSARRESVSAVVCLSRITGQSGVSAGWCEHVGTVGVGVRRGIGCCHTRWR